MEPDRVSRQHKTRRLAISWSGCRRLWLTRPRIELHQIPWYDMSRWYFSVTVTEGGYWQISCGPWHIAPEVVGRFPVHVQAGQEIEIVKGQIYVKERHGA